MGLFVLPVFAADDPDRIDYMQVSVSLPSAAAENASEQAAGLAVATPMSGAQVFGGIGSAENSCVNVVEFPTILGQLPVFTPTDEPSVTVHPNVGLTENGLRF